MINIRTMSHRRLERAFALPTVGITAVILMMLLVGALSSVSNVRRSLSAQYYNQLAREAAESGIAMAKWCLANSGGSVTWSASQPLRPSTNCSGGAACTGNSSCYVMSNDSVRTTFEVGTTTLQAGTRYTVQVSATAQLLQGSTSSVWQTYPYTEYREINLAAAPVTAGLVLYLDAGNPASYTSGSSTWNDLSGLGNNGTLVGTVGYSASDGGALSFTGSGYIRVPNTASLRVTGSQTLDFWIYPTSLAAGRQNILDKAYGGEFSTTLEPAGNMTTYYGTYGGQGTPYQGWYVNSVAQNKWQHITVVRDLSAMMTYTYLNGNISTAQAALYPSATASSYDVTLGYGYTGVYYRGLIASARVYNRALSYPEIRQNFISQRDRYYSASQTSCSSILKAGLSTGSGVYTINPNGTPLTVYCDMTTDGGGWTLVLQNNSAVATPAPAWEASVNGNTVTGTMSNNLTTFDQLVGLNYWNILGTQMRVQVGSSPSAISHKAMYSFYINGGSSFTLNLSNENIVLGGTQPGIYLVHNGQKWTTSDVDNDTYASNCAAQYANHPWWYTSCWSGNFLAGGSYQDAAYWVGSGTEYYAHGSIWVR